MMATEREGILGVKDHYKHCIRLSASNKINPKNAFDLQLIDYMQDLVDNNEDGQMNFKIASSALDVGAKIYSNRVDNIQSEAQKVASSILMALDDQHPAKNANNPDDSQADGDNSANNDIDLNDSNNLDEEGHKKKNKKRTLKKSVKTVVEENILDSKLDKMVLGDPYLDGLSRDFDMSCPAALICYNALTQPGCVLTIESSFMRKNYKDASDQSHDAGTQHITTTTSTPSKPLETIIEEPESENDQTVVEDEQESREQPNQNKTREDATLVENSEDSVQHTKDADGDDVMDDETETSDKTSATMVTQINVPTGSTCQSTTSGSTTNNLSEHYNLVTLITRHANCAQIIRNNINNHICPRLENFLFNDRTTTISGINTNLDESIVNLNERPNLDSSKTTGGAHEFNPELYDKNQDNNGGDDYVDDHFGDADSVLGDNEEEDPKNNLLPNLDQIAASRPTDYGYSNEHHRLMKTWAGPHAWKMMKAPQTAKKDGAGMLTRTARKRAKLELFPKDFVADADVCLEKLADKEIRHSSDVLRKWKKPLLPLDHNLTEESIRQTILPLCLRPEDTYHCMKSPADAFKLVGKDHNYLMNGDNGNDENQDEVSSTSPAFGGFDDVHDDDDDEDEFRADPVVGGNELAIYGAPINTSLTDLDFAGEDLIEQPYTVAHVNIPFAKIAKKMDVRRLKRVMWDLLFPPEKRDETMAADKTIQANDVTVIANEPMTNGDDPDKTLVTSEGGDRPENGADDTSMVQVKKTLSPEPNQSVVHLQFSNLYGELPIRVSSKMANDLSQSIAFVTLLHLANEKNLKLIPSTDLKDFVIEQDD